MATLAKPSAVAKVRPVRHPFFALLRWCHLSLHNSKEGPPLSFVTQEQVGAIGPGLERSNRQLEGGIHCHFILKANLVPVSAGHLAVIKIKYSYLNNAFGLFIRCPQNHER